MTIIQIPQLRYDQSLIVADPHRWKVVRCGRRWGKTVMLSTIAESAAAHGEPTAIYAPQFATLQETFREIRNVLDPIITNASQGHEIRTSTGGAIDFWSLQPGGLFGRGRKYKRVLIDEAAFSPPGTLHEYRTAILSLMKEFEDSEVYVFSTPAEPDLQNFFYALHEHDDYRWIEGDKKGNRRRFKQFWRPTHSNPMVPSQELQDDKETMHPLAYRQEVLAEFVDWSGTSLFSNLNHGVDPHSRYDFVFAVIDTAMKSGVQHDGTAVMWFGYSDVFGPDSLHILDWEITSLEAVDQYEWLKKILIHGEAVARYYGAHQGFTGAHIEDKQSGIVLLQQGRDAGLPVSPIDSRYTALGKDERMRLCVNPAYAGRVKFVHDAYNKTTEFKSETKNHALTQVLSYRIGDKEAYKRADDLADCFSYGVIQTLVPNLT
ncbi:hypothetical protein [Burkholderia cepacia]|uniref:hypothetical protein n=1 Tax=Burkholderia cepacia TaxID=292 RepID=UPI000AD055A1|nr:hypothetical protein [Burkholderia cepacia]